MKKNVFAAFCAALALICLISGLFSACAFGNPADITYPAPSSQKPVQSDPPARNKTIIVYARSMDDTDTTKILIDEFNKQNDKIYVKYQELPADVDKLYEQYTESLGSSRADFDVIEFDLSLCAEFAEKGYLTNLDSYIGTDGVNTDAYFPNSIAAVTYSGALWGMPKNLSAGALFYRNDILKTPPKTWDELISFYTMVNYVNAKYGFVFAGKPSETLVCEAMELIHAYGGELFDENGICVIASPNSRIGLEKLYQLYRADFTAPNMNEMTYIDAYVSFTAADTAITRNWTSVFNTGAFSGNPLWAEDVSFAELPSGPSGGGSALTGNMLAINRASKYKNEAWEFIKFAVSDKGQKLLAMNSGRFPTLTSVLRDTELLEKYPQFGQFGFYQAVATAFPKPITPKYRSFSLSAQQELALFLNGEQNAQTTLLNIQSKVNAAGADNLAQ
jgi:multiple sugar transport system substrate-binding protein